jgi:hypothetical protein
MKLDSETLLTRYWLILGCWEKFCRHASASRGSRDDGRHALDHVQVWETGPTVRSGLEGYQANCKGGGQAMTGVWPGRDVFLRGLARLVAGKMR